MGGALRKTMIYLGLAEDDDRYDGYDAFEEEPELAEPEWPPKGGASNGGAAAGHPARGRHSVGRGR
jgi:cell division inhibitor SepF